MKRRKTPAQKKAESYEKDHIVASEYRHAFRKQWPRKKAKNNRRARRISKQDLKTLITQNDELGLEEVPRNPQQRKKIYKWDVIPLGEWINHRVRVRVARAASKYYRTPYSREKHREKFSGFLNELTKDTDSRFAFEAARHFSLLLDPPTHRWEPYFWGNRVKRKWLRQFLEDAPEWETRLEEWIAETLKE